MTATNPVSTHSTHTNNLISSLLTHTQDINDNILFSAFSAWQDSRQVVSGALVDRSVLGARPLDKWQFERLGYFCLDQDSTADQVS